MSRKALTYRDVLRIASDELLKLSGRNLGILDIAEPLDVQYGIHLAKVVSKISPLIGNMIEYQTINILNRLDWLGRGNWKRQDPGFPDTIFEGDIRPTPGIEIKTWFPLATEITARFKDSVSHFSQGQTNVAMIAWLPEFLIYGEPRIVDVWVGTARSLAEARDAHYHNPPDYLVFEPEDTSERTSNLQQTNTNGYKFQGTEKQFKRAEEMVAEWGPDGKAYKPTKEYQKLLKQLQSRFPYRLDTNYAKMDRIEHKELEGFKARVLHMEYLGKKICEWSESILYSEETIKYLLGLKKRR